MRLNGVQMFLEDGQVISHERHFGYPKNRTCIAIGWLGKYGAFPQGEVPARVLATLTSMAFVGRERQSRGFHHCDHCSEEFIEIRRGAESVRLGSAELWVSGSNGKLYVAPDLIIHYIRDHNYMPPQEFIDAVMARSAGESSDID